MKMILTAAAALLALGSAADARDRTLAPEAREIGAPISCVNLRQIRNTSVRNDSVIDFYMLGGKVYRNTLPLSCPTLGFEERFLYRTSTSQLCSVDIITVLQSPDLRGGPSCGLGQFQPVEIVKTAAR